MADMTALHKHHLKLHNKCTPISWDCGPSTKHETQHTFSRMHDVHQPRGATRCVSEAPTGIAQIFRRRKDGCSQCGYLGRGVLQSHSKLRGKQCRDRWSQHHSRLHSRYIFASLVSTDIQCRLLRLDFFFPFLWWIPLCVGLVCVWPCICRWMYMCMAWKYICANCVSEYTCVIYAHARMI